MLRDQIVTRWLISAVASAFEPHGIQTPGILVFQGLQGMGKTRWFNALAPKALNLLIEGRALKPSDKDSVLEVVCFWLCELGEIETTFSKSAIGSLKAFITKDKDVIRPPYAKRYSEYERRTAFFGSVNEPEYLVDDTGNRRFWTVPVLGLNYQHTLDMQQVWAEIYETLYRQGKQWWPTKEESDLINAKNLEHGQLEPIAEMLQDGYDWSVETKHGHWLSATAILRELGVLTPKKSDTNKCASWARKLAGKQRGSPPDKKSRLLWVGKLVDAAQGSTIPI